MKCPLVSNRRICGIIPWHAGKEGLWSLVIFRFNECSFNVKKVFLLGMSVLMNTTTLNLRLAATVTVTFRGIALPLLQKSLHGGKHCLCIYMYLLEIPAQLEQPLWWPEVVQCFFLGRGRKYFIGGCLESPSLKHMPVCSACLNQGCFLHRSELPPTDRIEAGDVSECHLCLCSEDAASAGEPGRAAGGRTHVLQPLLCLQHVATESKV